MSKASLNRIRIDFDTPLTKGKLINRYKRFLADVELEDGTKVTVHCPNSGSMRKSLKKGAPVYLSPSKNPARKTPFTWEMIRINQGWVGINTLIPNKLVKLAATGNAHPLFKGAYEVRGEVKTSEHTRLDLAAKVPGGELFVEVKNVTMVEDDGRALFPDSRTERGVKHLGELMRLKKEGHLAAMVYVVQRGDAKAFGPAREIDPGYAEAYEKARRAGVEVVALEAMVSPTHIHLNRQLPLL